MRPIVERKSKGVSIDERIQHFIDTIKNHTGPIAPTCRNERRWLGAEGDGKNGYSLRTIKSYISRYRNQIALQLPHHGKLESSIAKLDKKHGGIISKIVDLSITPLENMQSVKRYRSNMKSKNNDLYNDLKSLKVPHESFFLLYQKGGDHSEIKSGDKSSVRKKMRDRMVFSSQAISEAVETGFRLDTKGDKKGLLSSNHKALLALILCSGRRPIELCKTGTFTAQKNGECIFKGQAKKKNGEVAEAYKIPILHVTPERFVELVDSFRSKLGDIDSLTPKQVNVKMSGESSDIARDLLLNRKAVLYTARAIYARMCIEKFNPEIDEDAYISDLLGHNIEDETSNRSYKSVVISDKPADDARAAYKAQDAKRERTVALGRSSDKKTTSKPTKATEAQANRIAKLQEAAEATGRACGRINEWAVRYVREHGETTFTQTMITKNGGFSRPAIDKWLKLVGK